MLRHLLVFLFFYPMVAYSGSDYCPTSSDFALLQAAYDGDLEKVEELLEVPGIDVNTRDCLRRTPLFCAASRKHTDVVEVLIAHEADMNVVECSTGLTPLGHAIMTDRIDMIKTLITKDADLEAPGAVGDTPLMYACIWNKMECARLLLEGGAEVNAVNEALGSSSLMYACSSGANFEIVELLLECGADARKVYRNGQTALRIAVLHRNYRKARVLLDHGADPHSELDPTTEDFSSLKCLFDSRPSVL